MLIQKKKIGIGIYLSKKIALRLEFNVLLNISNLSKEYSSIIFTILNNFIFNFLFLKKKIFTNIFFFFLISSYKGNRHELGLPLNGQRT